MKYEENGRFLYSKLTLSLYVSQRYEFWKQGKQLCPVESITPEFP
jgi:hypothetical protein